MPQGDREKLNFPGHQAGCVGDLSLVLNEFSARTAARITGHGVAVAEPELTPPQFFVSGGRRPWERDTRSPLEILWKRDTRR